MSVYTLNTTSCQIPTSFGFERFTLCKNYWYPVMMANSTVMVSHTGNDDDDDDNSTSLGSIMAASILCAIVMVTVVIVLVYRMFRKRSGPLWITKFYHQDQYSTMRNDDSKEDNFIIGFANPMMEATGQDGEDGNVKALAYRPLDNDNAPDNKDNQLLHHKFLFPREKLTYGAEIGTGWFGKVYRGEATRIVPGLRKTKVIIKKLREDSTSEQRKQFLNEVLMFKSSNHENVLEFLGQATEKQPYLVVFEHSPLGNLKEYLISHRNDAVSIKQRLIPLKMAVDIGSGLEFLHSKCFYHSDLATRNCIVNSDLSVKIGDYGVSRDLYQSDYYKDPKSSGDSLPVRWLDPESVCCDSESALSVKPLTATENVWSFGVTLWEIVEFGRQPYEELTDEEVLQSVILDRLYQLPEPKETGILATQMYDMMKWCWCEPTRRPSVEDMASFLRDLLETIPELMAEMEGASVEEQPLDTPCSSVNQYKQPVAVVRPLQCSSEKVEEKLNEIIENTLKSDSTTNNNNLLENEDLTCNEGDTNDIQVTAICDDQETAPVTAIYSESSQEHELRKTSLKRTPKQETDQEWTTPVTYIGGPSDGLTERRTSQGTSEEILPSCSHSEIVEVKYSNSEPSVIVENCPSGYVVLPGERLRRKSSILRHADTKSTGHIVHFPANILDLRVIHHYCREEEDDDEETENKQDDGEDHEGGEDHDGGEDNDGGEVDGDSASLSKSPPSTNLTIDLPKKDDTTTYETDDGVVPEMEEHTSVMGSALILERPISPVEKRVKKATRKKQLNRHADEWLFSIDQEQ